MNAIMLNAYAKINLHLEITGKRVDGYHTIESLMQSISLADILTIRREHTGISLVCDDPALSCGEDNLVVRAAKAFLEAGGIVGGASMVLQKRIPSQAGMGGGSSDAAATLRGLNLLYGSVLREDALYDLAAKLGADVPFCLRGRASMASEIGTDLRDAPSLPSCHLVIGIGEGEKMSTKDAYAALDALSYEPQNMDAINSSLKRQDLSDVCAHLFNRFTVLNPSAQEGMARLRAWGAQGTLLCGSGAAFFGIYDPKQTEQAIQAAQALRQEGYRTWLASPIG